MPERGGLQYLISEARIVGETRQINFDLFHSVIT
jgi:hypothetical protein